jgi:predicted RNase H-like nuclease (RuvC/YqgF family)
MPTLEARVFDVEQMTASLNAAMQELARVSVETKRELTDFKDEMKDFKDEMKDFKEEMKAFKDEMKEFKEEMKVFKDEMREFKIETRRETEALIQSMADFRREMADERKKMNKAWGDLANKLGTIIEDIVAPNIEWLARERFECVPLEAFLVRALKRGSDGVMREFDVVAVGGGRVLLAESKSTLTSEAVAEFVEKRRTFFDHFPDYQGRELISIKATWRVEEPGRLALNANRIYGLEMGEETMRLVNDGEF